MRSAPVNFDADEVNVIVAFELEFDSGAVRMWNGYRTITIEDEEYVAGGHMISISGFNETSDISAQGARVTINGFDSASISIALQENYQNRPMRIMVGSLNNGVPSVYTIFRGRMDVMQITESGDSAQIVISGENRLIDLERARSARYTSEDQKLYYPDDLGLDYIASLQDKVIDWGG